MIRSGTSQIGSVERGQRDNSTGRSPVTLRPLPETDAKIYTDMYGDQSNFVANTKIAIETVKSFLDKVEHSSASQSLYDELLKLLGRKRQELVEGENIEGFGVLRDLMSTVTYTLLSSGNYVDRLKYLLQNVDENGYIFKGPFEPHVSEVEVLDDKQKVSYFSCGDIFFERFPFQCITSADGLISIYLHDDNDLRINQNDFNKFITRDENNNNQCKIKKGLENNIDFLKSTSVIVNSIKDPDDISTVQKSIHTELNSYFTSLRNESYTDAFNAAAKVAFHFFRLAPYCGGSSWAGEVLLAAMLRGIPGYENISFMRSALDFMAFGNPEEPFVKELRAECDKMIKESAEEAFKKLPKHQPVTFSP
ncbi:MAG: hypothetical protein AAF621_03680 [Pseudomonadota bacterium]